MAGLQKPEYVSYRDLIVRRESIVPRKEKQMVLDKYARTLGSLNELDEQACQVVYITKPAEEVRPEINVKTEFRALAERLCEEHPAISMSKDIFGGMPHIKNVRLSVGNVLAKLYVYGNIQAILETYAPHVSEEQIREAIAYAQDFLEIACDPNESPESDD